MAEGSFSFSQLSWIASGNYAGIWLAVCYFRLAHFTSLRAWPISVGFCPGERVVDPRNGMVLPFILVLLIRVLAGVASAGC